MTNPSTVELEREAEQRRAGVADTAERLRAKLTPGQLLDEMAHTFRGGDWSTAANNLKAQVRDNPLALALIGAGIACMATGVPGISSRRGTAGSARSEGGVGETVGSAYRGMQDAAGNVRDSASAAGSAVGDRLASGASTLSDFVHGTEHRTREAVDRVGDELTGMLQREPLVTGAVGLAIGAALGALLPETRFEQEHLGPHEDRLKKGAADAAKKAVRQAGDVATAAGHAAIDEADRQGLVAERDAAKLSERVDTAADDALGKADDALSGKGGSAGRSAPAGER
jgi:hypothetical protein